MLSSCQSYFGKYRGKVSDNLDPTQCGRLKVNVPSVLGTKNIWALPCVPYAGPQIGLVLIPPKGANVWVEFESGDLSKPIWSGCFWDTTNFPKEATASYPAVKLLKTENITLSLSDQSGAIAVNLKIASPALNLKLDKEGIELSNGSVSIVIKNNEIALTNGSQSLKVAAAKVAINGNHLEVV